ncbi:leucyl aminopeptidase [Chloroflexota bacterium]
MEIKAIVDDIARVKAGAVIVNHFEGVKQPEGTAAAVDKALGGAISQLIKQGEIKGKLNEITILHSLGKIPANRVAVVGLGKKKDLTVNRVREAVADTCRYLRQKGVTSLASIVQGAGINGISPENAAQAMTEGARLGLYSFRKYLTKQNQEFGEIKQLRIVNSKKGKPGLEKSIARGSIMAEAANWARDLVNEPASYMTPSRMAEAAQKLAKSYGLKVEVLEPEQMAAAGMGALLGVAQGSQQPPRFIILSYKGSDSGTIDIALVGKGITFDSGGISIKPSEAMAEMKGDMAGGASVMAAIGAIAQLKAGINVTAIVPATENLPSGTALKPGDILTAMNGKTIEVLNTDAEGRLILADALSYANKLGAKSIIDIATLTGACHIALGDLCTGAFTNNQKLADRVISAGSEAGEYTWQLPMYAEYRELIKSDIADIKNIGNRYGGAITAAKFLAEFIDNIPWVHLDIAGTFETKKERGYLVKGATGVPVRTLINLVLSLADSKKKK